MSDELYKFVRLFKVDEAKREVWGVVTAAEPDKDGEICDYETTVPYYKEVVDEMSKATNGVNIFPLRAMHGLTAAGKGIGIEFRDAAQEVFMGFKVVDDAEWKKVAEGVYTGFSQGGRYIKRWKDGDYVRYTAAPGEVSLVDMPCLTRAHFEYIKADGRCEIRKFKKAQPIMPDKPGEIPSTPDKNVVGDIPPEKVSEYFGCHCGCDACMGGNCALCQENPQCEHMEGKSMKFLVSIDGKNYLPYTDVKGRPHIGLMAKCWARLHGSRHVKAYTGPDKAKAIKRLKQEFAKKGSDTPDEVALKAETALKALLTDVINNRAYGRLNKGMYTISRFAAIIEELKWLWVDLMYERELEGDESPATDDLGSVFESLLDSLLAYTEEEVEEERSRMADRVNA